MLDKQGSKFSVANEFVLHAFQAHLLAHIYTLFGISSSADPIQHECSLQWLQDKAKEIVDSILVLKETSDRVVQFSISFMHSAFLYRDLREAMQYENTFFVTGKCGFHISSAWDEKTTPTKLQISSATCNVHADFPKHISYIAVHNRTVNTTGRAGHAKPIDQMVEHYVKMKS